jgi:hypothetical protein
VPAQPVEVVRTGRSGRRIVKIDRLGGIFTPIRGKRLFPVFGFGADDQKKDTMLTCPVSAIPDEVWQTVHLWQLCRLTRTLPVAGGLLDQPMVVQRAFPILDVEQRKLDAKHPSGPEQAAALAVGQMVKLLKGGR